MPTVKIDTRDGSPALYINGEKTAPVLYGLSDIPGSRSNTHQAYKNISQFASAGIRLITADVNLNTGWHKHFPFESEPVQAEIAGILEACPDALVILRLHVNPPYWWLRDNPDELVSYNGEPGIDDGESYRLIREDGSKLLRASFASKKWLSEAGEKICELCKALSNTAEGGHVIGIQIAYGVYGEWHQFGIDTSMPMRRRFTRFLKEKYRSDSALKAAWGRDDVTFENAEFCPDPNVSGTEGLFRHPIKEKYISDAQECLQTTAPEAILHFCRIVKRSWRGDILTGSFYGYFLTRGNRMQVIQGHMLPSLLFDARDAIDFLCGPFPYMENRTPEGVPLSRGLIEACRIRGILWLTEMDQHPTGTETYVGGDPEKWEENRAMLRRNLFWNLCAGAGIWYYDHRIVPIVMAYDKSALNVGSVFLKKGWWDTPEWMEEIASLQRLACRYSLPPYRPEADVAVIFDTRSYFAMSGFCESYYEVMDAVARTGAAYDCLYLESLPYADLDRYRVLVFVHTYAMTDSERAFVAGLAKEKYCIFLYAPAYVGEGGLSEEHMFELLGMEMKKLPSAMSYTLESGDGVSASTSVSPVFAVCDEDATVLGRYDSGEIAAATKGNITYSALPNIHRATVKEAFRRAGVHFYSDDGDPCAAGGGLVVLYTHDGGEKQINFKNGRTITVDLPPLTCAAWDAESCERVL